MLKEKPRVDLIKVVMAATERARALYR